MTEAQTKELGVSYVKQRIEEAGSDYTVLEISLLWQDYQFLPKQYELGFDEWLTILLRKREPSKPGWYTDPETRTLDRWWMGSQWSETYRIKPDAGS